LPVVYKGDPLDIDFRMDLVVEDAVVVELKSVQALLPVHEAQLHTYLKISFIPVGLPLNFNELRLIDGVRRRLLQPVTAPSLA
jgi:GxxExxY protein